MKTACTFLIAALTSLVMQAQYSSPHSREDAYRPYTIQVALLLDASGSMDGLIDQAKSRLWYIVNDLSTPDDYGQMPALEFALYEYGRSNLPRQSGYIRQVVPFTQDLDWLAEELFRLRTGGGEEYSGLAIQRSLDELDWTRSPRDLRFVYIAGNESFRQGNVSYRSAASSAYARGIYVNTIFCGDYYEGIRLGWEEGAVAGGGIYTHIDQNARWQGETLSHFQHLSSLNQQYNSTYIPYGSLGETCRLRQIEQDRRTAGYGQNYANERYLAKSGPAYSNAHWDLVDAVATGTVHLEQIQNEDLPAVMRNMNLREKQTYVAARQAERKRIGSEMKEMATEGRQEVASLNTPPAIQPQASGQPAVAKPAPKTLDKAIQESVQQKKKEVEAPRQPMTPVKTPVATTPEAVRPSGRPVNQPVPSTQVPVRQETQAPQKTPQVATPSSGFSPGKAPAAATPAALPSRQATPPAPKTLPDRGHQQSDPATAMPAPAKTPERSTQPSTSNASVPFSTDSPQKVIRQR